VIIRPLTGDDLPFLRRMLDAAAFWRRGLAWRLGKPGLRLLFRNYLALYHADWGREGDLALVAEIDGEPVGAVWYRLFTEASHGDGYIDDDTPELVIAVVDGHRGRGIGRALLEAIAEAARERGLGRIGLSVDHDNPAKRLYAAVGYRELEPGTKDDRMVLDVSS
jgi:ribosomal protein S18 acetylase RimI-like enzyme